MRFYAEHPARVARQVLGDALAVAWLVSFVLLARTARRTIEGLAEPGRSLVDAGDAARGAFDDAARAAAGIPFVGDELAVALGSGTGAAQALADAGRGQVAAVAALALGAWSVVVALGVLPVLLGWLPLRLRYARAAGSAVAARDTDPDLLALHALTHRSVRRLRAVTPDPAAAWRRGEPDVVHRLAELELRALGLHPTAREPTEVNRSR